MTDEKAGEVISFSEASNPHVLARKEAKLKKVQGAFEAASKDGTAGAGEETTEIWTPVSYTHLTLPTTPYV